MHSTYCGHMATQSWDDFYLWEQLFNEQPQHDGLIELGTGHGGFSLYLKHQAEARNIVFLTFDNDTWVGFKGSKPTRDHLVCSFRRYDIFKEHQVIQHYIERFESPILFCDNGDKPREIRLFEPVLPIGALLVVHDWATEVTWEDIPQTLKELQYYSEHTKVFEKCA